MYQQYKRKGLSEMTPWVEGFDMTNVSVSEVDKQNGSPKPGDMIARNPKNHQDKWLVAEKYFNDNLELADEEESETVYPDTTSEKVYHWTDKVISEYNLLYDKTKNLFEFTNKSENADKIGKNNFDLLVIQYGAMYTYLKTLEIRLNLAEIETPNSL